MKEALHQGDISDAAG